MDYLDAADKVLASHKARMVKGHKQYGRSCLKRGGVGLFMMVARKWDRIEEQVKDQRHNSTDVAPPWDIMRHIRVDNRPEGVADDVRDLIDYLLILECELVANGQMPPETRQVTAPSFGEEACQGRVLAHTYDRPEQDHPHGYNGA